MKNILTDKRFPFLCAGFGIPPPTREYKFHPTRKWRFDWAWPDKKIALEIEGGAWTGGRHTRGKGFLNDMEKYNEAVILGWSVLRATPQQVCNFHVFSLLKRVHHIQ